MANKVSVDFPAEVFDAKTNVALIHQVVVAQRAAARQGTHKTKTRSEVSAPAPSRSGRRAPAVPVRVPCAVRT